MPTTPPLRAFLDNLSEQDLIERLHLALEGSGLGIWDWDPRDNSVQFDRRWCEMLGLDHGSVAMELSTWESRVHPDDLADCYADIKAHVEGKTDRYENVHRMRHADGRWVHILDRGRIASRDGAGNPIRFTGTHLDVTATEQAKRVLEDQHRILREFVRHVPAPVAMLDTKLNYIATSSRWGASLDAANPDKTGHLRLEQVPHLCERWLELCARGLQGEHVAIEEEHLERPDGSACWWSWEVHPWLDADGSTGGVLVSATCVTDAVLARLAEAQENRLAELGRMAGEIAHEINTPLQILDLESESIVEELSSPEPCQDDLSESAAAIACTVTRLSEVVKAMRALSRAPSNDAPAAVNVAEVLADVRALSSNRFSANDVALVLNAELPEGTEVLAHASDVGQVLLNLLNNALDAVRGRQDATVTLDVMRDGDEVAFQCTDNGPGVSPQVRDRVMQPFFTTKPVGGGTGLGLSVSRSLAKKNHGDLRLAPFDNGARFVLTLPMNADRSG